MASADYIFAKEVSKHATRSAFGIRKEEPDVDELMKLVNKQMILDILGSDVCLSELSTDEQAELSTAILLKS